MNRHEFIEAFSIPETLSGLAMTKEEALEKGVFSTSAWEKLCENNPDITFHGILPLGFSPEYVLRRDFSHMIAMREFIQNALDETELISGKPSAQTRQDGSTLWIEDNGRGITLDAFRMGGVTKESWMRGYYGEGLKLAATHLVAHQIPVTLFARHDAYHLVLSPETRQGTFFVVLGKTKTPVEGTKIRIKSSPLNRIDLLPLVRFWNPLLEGTTIAEEHYEDQPGSPEKPSCIFDYPNELYVRNMYVGKMSKVAKRDALLSYDLWWFRLDVTRTLQTATVPLLFEEISRVLSLSLPARQLFVKKIREAGMLKISDRLGIPCIEFNPIFATVEGHLFVYACPAGMIDAFVDELGLKEQQTMIRRVKDDDEARLAHSKGFIPMQLHYELTEELDVIPAFSA